ncbi:MAG: hypothetical protein LBC87_04175 [Fibromonadaceae bacterium]|nr:hypothetical protein [Fibromonadaceae bacterium]
MNKTAIIALLICTAVFAQQKGSFTDVRDKKNYKTVTIGTQTWMAENLDYGGKNGDMGECICKKPEYCKKYGALYTEKEAKEVCPPGWHLPSDTEWQTLVDFAGGKEIAGKKLKAKNGWKEIDPRPKSCCDETYRCKYKTEKRTGRGDVVVTEHDECPTDEFGFAALPGDESRSGNTDRECRPKSSNPDVEEMNQFYNNFRTKGAWWSRSGGGWFIENGPKIVKSGHFQGGYSVRCIKNAGGEEAATQKTVPEVTTEKATQAEAKPEAAVTAVKPSFDCAKASTPTENAICSDAELAKLDNTLNREYSKASSVCKQGQKEWVNNRNACSSNIQCLKNSYILRIQVLKSCQ